ncbi:MAG: UDP-N-acetylmuramate dehydrogenase [Gammaproteobacteria bacterium]|jgi:UDP-N-acetylmuramate dehydrogenase|nr:UDP-N-acetylmuramate dehydrogenase [Pseudomonadota bacterium]MCZ6732920.1 UDP-N-acetylmuramate dehydrogenase [Gammaproteobacteria bacterium]
MIVAHKKGSLRGQLRVDEPMSRHTSWRVGGCADYFYVPADIADLAMYLNSLPTERPVYWLGLGSNMLVRDGGIRGCVIATSGALNRLQMVGEHRVRVEAGVAGAKVARFTVGHGLTGAQFLAGIPGTMGGALAMNAGAFGGETWDIVDKVETIDRQGRVRNRMRSEFKIGYRHITGPADEWFVAAHLRLTQGDVTEGKANIRILLAKRDQTQPTQIANAGSVFKNPPGDYAARLIEASGMKGLCVGTACVSQVHANFIVNTGSATAADIEDLMQRVRKGVEQQQGVALETEVRIVGEA